ncbi:OVARIAN TUMOR DOMAIN-containing deubiquitinating enzyme 10-like [Hibiscus syriacus]|uniref:OVARIAN TUMOR DOMAIN-containing deubiquitinating enzyme 10-like n=1 Tax=Hibiscus syriacus TaxID=106335 RepID=UPI001923673C|nr:OVARIAN TUMOR DOMAIN-containing deubiquitinating enzyme 10-like [Hibiscus syriacus]XP_039068100.1 OVARIAN TUMOR DOMAIN-containing deubiquitinating enzyme 10-like [Hibiscus syriacus]
MTMYQQDSDFVHWVLGGDPFYHCAYSSDMVQHDAGDIYHHHTHYYRGHTDTQSSQIENDEVIARTLQEEFSHLAVAEASEFSHAGEEQSQSSSEHHDWHTPSTTYYYSGYEYGQDESDDLVPHSSCSSPNDSEDFSGSLELTEGYLLDDEEVGKRFNQMIPIPHVPRINGEIPSIDEAMSDHERLLSRLQLYGFAELKVQGDGNCQFRALSHQLYHTPDNHKYVRRQIVNQLKSNPEAYEGYVPMDYADYLKKMSKSGEWGDHVTLQAAADAYGLKIIVMTSFKDTCYIEILPNFWKSKGVIFLSFWAEVHYNSIYCQGDHPSAEVPRKKKWWTFGN